MPLLADLTTMRSAAARLKLDPQRIEPLLPVDLVVDHSVMINHYAGKRALDLNMKLEFQGNRERYRLMKWGMGAFKTSGVVPGGFGIVHEVNRNTWREPCIAKAAGRTPSTTPRRGRAPTARQR